MNGDESFGSESGYNDAVSLEDWDLTPSAYELPYWEQDACSGGPVDSLPRAINAARAKKSKRMKRFLEVNGYRLDRQHIQQLRSFASSSGGLINDEIRTAIWPVLASNMSTRLLVRSDASDTCDDSRSGTWSNGECINEEREGEESGSGSDSDFESAVSKFSCSGDDNEQYDMENSPLPSIDELRTHKDWNQVALDVDRTLARFPPNISDEERELLQEDLTPLVVGVLAEDPAFNYYQGFHDVCLTLLLALNKERAFEVARTLVRRSCFRNYLTMSLEESALKELQHLYVLLYLHDQELEQHMRLAELGCLFALSWPLTWFSHSLPHYHQIVIFFDLLLASHPMMPIYVTTAVVAERREEILRSEADMPVLHHLLTNMPATLNIDRVLEKAQELMQMFPPSLVTGEYRVEYEKMCLRERRRRISIANLQQRIPKPGTVPRNNIFSASISPWVVMGTAASAVALYLYVANSYLHQSALM